MGTTALRALPYPEPGDPADVPVDMRELAERVEAVLLASAFGPRIYNRTFTLPSDLTSTGAIFWPDPTGIPLTPPAGATFLLAKTIITGLFDPTGVIAILVQQQAGTQFGGENTFTMLQQQRFPIVIMDEIPVAGVNGLIMNARTAGGTGSVRYDATCRMRYEVAWR